MKLRIFAWLLLVAAAAILIFSADSYLTQRSLAAKTIRLHVVANSDSDEDQAEKLRVRDAVLRNVAALTADCGDANAARTVLASHLNELQTSAQRCTEKPVTVSLGEERFATRYYDTFTLPAGIYPSLRVKIGAAQGHNWWCVVFPTLCTAAESEDLRTVATSAGLTRDEIALMTEENPRYQPEFKLLEWLTQLRALLAGN